MVRVSKKKLKRDALLRLHGRFASVIAEAQTKRAGHQLLEELLTPAEQIVLAKRLAIIFLLLEGISPYYAAAVLNVSTSTTQRIYAQQKAREYPYLTRVFTKQKDRELFWNEMKEIIRLGMPPMGRGRWQWLDVLEDKYKRKKNMACEV